MAMMSPTIVGINEERHHYIIRTAPDGEAPNYYDAGQQFVSTPEQPYRLAASYRWQDDYCPVQELEQSRFCNVCGQLNLTRFLIVGDSMSLQFMFSVLSLLGHTPSPERTTWFKSRIEPFHIRCNNRSNGPFNISFWQYPNGVEEIGALDETLDPNFQYSDALYRPFVENNNNRTAIVLNRGAWIYNMSHFEKLIRSDLEWLDSLADNNSILAFYRPSVPGHPGCQQFSNNASSEEPHQFTDERPFVDSNGYSTTTQERIQQGAPHFNWMDFERYNAHVQTTLEQRRRDEHRQEVPVHWINIVPSGKLRRDGHVGPGDCLHYSLPGPTDWWAHFFFSMLADLAVARTTAIDVARD